MNSPSHSIGLLTGMEPVPKRMMLSRAVLTNPDVPMCPYGDSNSGLQIENLPSWATRR